ncbi:TetR family transcriptional regulator [Scopulibacillus darangshiensis]|uniref:TetR family transcriptional regulator n=1 Tax=Scopulibacillus darangshiensis TaxID=442528 RepID=A0A4R2NCR3_9BACL|nr:TetR/AcrR family transcriptional regulator [Scopulibacillus darangshiensis]TCP18999.1 TetR family transcriptional regulator [Scopulibacillus darangshiensis]
METKDKIKSISLKMFAERGFEGTSLAQIAAGVGIKKPSLYNYYSGKEELFWAVFQGVLWDYVAHIEERYANLQEHTVETTLRELLYCTCKYYWEHEDESALLKRVMLFPYPPLEEKVRSEFLVSEEATTRILKEVFQKGMDEGVIKERELVDLLATFYCLIDGLFVQMFYYPKQHFESKLESAWRIFWSGIQLT